MVFIVIPLSHGLNIPFLGGSSHFATGKVTIDITNNPHIYIYIYIYVDINIIILMDVPLTLSHSYI